MKNKAPRRWFADVTFWWTGAPWCYACDAGEAGTKGVVDDFGSIAIVKISDRLTGDISDYWNWFMERERLRARRVAFVEEGRTRQREAL